MNSPLEEVRQEQSPSVDIHPMIAAAFAELDRAGERWLLLRGVDDLSHPSGDVDLLVSRTLLPQLDSLLKSCGFQRMIARGHGSHQFYFGYDDTADLWLKLDVVSEIEFGPLQQWRTPLADECLDRRRPVGGGLWLPETSDGAWLQLLHLLLDKGEILPAKIDPAFAAAQAAAADDPVGRYLDDQAGVGTAVAVLDAVRGRRFDDIPALADRTRRAWTSRVGARTRSIELANRAQRLLSPTLPQRFTRGLSVAVMGPDGAGKTTLLNGLGADFPLPSKYVYMGLWSAGRWDGWVHRTPGGRLGQKMVRLTKGSLTAAYHHRRGRLVLLDRVSYDAKLPGSVDTSVGGRITSALLLAFGPKPDVLLMLDAPGEVMFARKGEHSVEILEGWRQAYLELAAEVPNSWVLDATSPPDVVRARSTAIVWSQLCGSAPVETAVQEFDR